MVEILNYLTVNQIIIFRNDKEVGDKNKDVDKIPLYKRLKIK